MQVGRKSCLKKGLRVRSKNDGSLTYPGLLQSIREIDQVLRDNVMSNKNALLLGIQLRGDRDVIDLPVSILAKCFQKPCHVTFEIIDVGNRLTGRLLAGTKPQTPVEQTRFCQYAAAQ